jgi:hypothetical protein
MTKNNMSLTLNMQMSNNLDYPNFNEYDFQTMTNHNIIYIRQIKADDK